MRKSSFFTFVYYTLHRIISGNRSVLKVASIVTPYGLRHREKKNTYSLNILQIIFLILIIKSLTELFSSSTIVLFTSISLVFHNTWIAYDFPVETCIPVTVNKLYSSVSIGHLMSLLQFSQVILPYSLKRLNYT